jgi:hypothetical protein
MKFILCLAFIFACTFGLSDLGREHGFIRRQLVSSSCKKQFTQLCGTLCATTGKQVTWQILQCQLACFRNNVNTLGSCGVPQIPTKVLKTVNCSEVISTTCSHCYPLSGWEEFNCYGSCALQETSALSHCHHEKDEIPGQPDRPQNCSDAIIQTCPTCFAPNLAFAKKIPCLQDCLDGKHLKECSLQPMPNCTSSFNATAACPKCNSLTGLSRVQCSLYCMENDNSNANHRNLEDGGGNVPEYEYEQTQECLFPGIQQLPGWLQVPLPCANAVLQRCKQCAKEQGIKGQAECWKECIYQQSTCMGQSDYQEHDGQNHD